MRKLPDNFHVTKYGLNVRLVNEDDAMFIVKLRTDPKLGRYIHSTDSDVEQQKLWIKKYKIREFEGKEYYFIFSIDHVDLGVYRLYDIEDDRFVSGSRVFRPDAPQGAGILGCIIGREIAYEILGLNRNFVDVRKQNKSSLKFQLSFDPIFLREDAENLYFEHVKENFYARKKQYIQLCTRFLSSKK